MNTSQLVQQVVVQLGLFFVTGLIIYGLTRLMRCRYCGWSFSNARVSSLWALAGILVGWILLSVILLTAARATSGASQGNPQVEPVEYSFNRVVNQLILALIYFGPVVLVMRLRREPWASAGVSKHNLAQATVVGLVLAAITVAALFTGSGTTVPGVLGNLKVDHFWAFLGYSVVGFGEEFAFRGFLQTRLIAWLGRWPGWLATSVLMALGHITQRMTLMGLVGAEAWISSILLMGYVMLRTENVVAPGLYHTFSNWAGTLV